MVHDSQARQMTLAKLLCRLNCEVEESEVVSAETLLQQIDLRGQSHTVFFVQKKRVERLGFWESLAYSQAMASRKLESSDLEIIWRDPFAESSNGSFLIINLDAVYVLGRGPNGRFDTQLPAGPLRFYDPTNGIRTDGDIIFRSDAEVGPLYRL
jgi:hypothetical protein